MQFLGKAFIRVDGQTLRTNKGAKIDLGGVVRTPVKGAHSVYGFSEEIKESMVECEINLGKGDKLSAYRDITDATITFECDTGQVFIVRGAAVQDPPQVTEGEGGKIPLKFFGQPAEEI